MNDKKEKFLRFLDKHRKAFITFVLTNRQFFSFVVLMTIETLTLMLCTLGSGAWDIRATFFDFAIILILGSLGYLFKPKKQYAYFQTILVLTSVICLINGIYYTFYNSFVTIGLIETLGQVNTVVDSVFDKLTPLHLIYVFFPIFYHLIHKSLANHNYFNYVSKIENGKKNFSTVILVGIVALCLNIVTLTASDISKIVKQWNRESIVQRFGVLTYQINDVVQSTQAKLFSYFGYDEAAQSFIEYYENRESKNTQNKYTGIFEGKNLVTVHMESMMTMFIDMKINGEEVTPNLNKLAKEGLYFSNFYPQVSVGTSSDTEFTLNTSLMPALSGTVFVTYYDRNYLSLEKILKEKGYYTFSMHANNGTMWNRSAMHKSLGYDKFYSKESYVVTDETTIGLGLSDHEFFLQSLEYLKDIEKENEHYMGTMITLTNHTTWNGGDAYGEFDLTKMVERVNEETGLKETVVDDYLEGKKIGNYIRSVHYADKCLGEFIDSLYENDLFNNTVLVFYGDHDAKLPTKEYNYLYNYDPVLGRLKEEEDDGYVEYDYYANELNRNTPLIIWTKDKKVSGKVDYYMGMIDLLPTLGNMFNFKSKYALGNDIFSVKNDNTVVFPNGNFLNENVYYNSSKGESKTLKDVVMDDSYIEEQKRAADKILEISNDIIVYNLIETEGDKIKSEET